jgi:hypothetical protein
MAAKRLSSSRSIDGEPKKSKKSKSNASQSTPSNIESQQAPRKSSRRRRREGSVLIIDSQDRPTSGVTGSLPASSATAPTQAPAQSSRSRERQRSAGLRDSPPIVPVTRRTRKTAENPSQVDTRSVSPESSSDLPDGPTSGSRLEKQSVAAKTSSIQHSTTARRKSDLDRQDETQSSSGTSEDDGSTRQATQRRRNSSQGSGSSSEETGSESQGSAKNNAHWNNGVVDTGPAMVGSVTADTCIALTPIIGHDRIRAADPWYHAGA